MPTYAIHFPDRQMVAETISEVRRLLIVYRLDNPNDRELDHVSVWELGDQKTGAGREKGAWVLLIGPPEPLIPLIQAEEWGEREWTYWHRLSESLADRGLCVLASGTPTIGISVYGARDQVWLGEEPFRHTNDKPVLRAFERLFRVAVGSGRLTTERSGVPVRAATLAGRAAGPARVLPAAAASRQAL